MAPCRKARPISPCCVWGFSEPQEWTLRSQRSTAAAPDSAATHKINGHQKGSALNHLQHLRQKKRVQSSPYRRTRTDQVEGGCFPEEERWPAQTHTYTHKRTHTGDCYHIISLIYTSPEQAEWTWCCQVKELCENRPQVSYTNIAISLSVKLPLLCPVTTARVSTATVENTQIKKCSIKRDAGQSIFFSLTSKATKAC